jgi:hypothetical protein
MVKEAEQWKADYEHGGYLVVEDVIDAATLAALKARLDDIAQDPESLPPRLRRHVQLERDYLASGPRRITTNWGPRGWVMPSATLWSCLCLPRKPRI